MQIPQGLGGRVIGGVGEAILQRGRRTMQKPRIAVEAGQRLRPACWAVTQETCENREAGEEEQDHAGNAAPARNFEPETEKGDGKKQAEERQQGCGRGPKPFPCERETGPRRETIEPPSGGICDSLSVAHGLSGGWAPSHQASTAPTGFQSRA